MKKLRNNTNQRPTIPPTQRLRSWLDKEQIRPPYFDLKGVTSNDFRNIMKKFKGKRTYGTDFIDSYSIKIAAPLIEDCLVHLINLSVQENKFADRWKTQLIHPFYKKKERDKLENYRPVSHLVQVGKLVEYVVYHQILEHFCTNNLFHPNHHGGLSNHSTLTAVVQVHDLCINAAENQELSAVCLLDQSAADDLMCHETLKGKLELYNFSQSAISWLMSYLGKRNQIVQIEAKTSNKLESDGHGVPQGSVLGGLLHIINSNDFPACHDSGESVIFVDDDSDVVQNKNPELLQNLIESEANNSAEWLKDNRLCVAAEKSKLLIVGSTKLKSSVRW